MFSEDVRARLAEAKERCGLSALPDAVAIAVLVVCLAGALWGLWLWAPWRTAEPPPMEVPKSTGPVAGALKKSEEETAPIVVHVVGAVHRPGVYELRSGARVFDAVKEAGGLLGNASEEGVNMARVAVDGEQIVVPTKEQARKAAALGQQAPGAAGGPSLPGKVDLNSAGEAQLDALPGVGPATAKKIVDDRTVNGPYRKPEDLMRVPGIGPKKFDALKDLVTAL